MIKVMIADDHRVVREGITKLLGTVDGIELGGQVADGDALLESLQHVNNTYDLVLMDLSMPNGGIDLIRNVRKVKPDLPILVLSMHNEPVIANQALKAGAAGYVTKDCDSESLIFAVMQVGKGGKFVDPSVIRTAEDAKPEPLIDRLTERENEIFLQLVKGVSVTDISDQLGLSIKTVSTHKINLMAKLGIKNNADLVRYAIKIGVIG